MVNLLTAYLVGVAVYACALVLDDESEWWGIIILPWFWPVVAVVLTWEEYRGIARRSREF